MKKNICILAAFLAVTAFADDLPEITDDISSEERAAAGDLMAYAEIPAVLVAFGSDAHPTNLTWYAVTNGTTALTVRRQFSTGSHNALTIYDYDGLTGVGTNVTVSGKVRRAKDATVVLVHDQVKASFGFNQNTASLTAYLDGSSVRTKPFTRRDKLMVARYRFATGTHTENKDPFVFTNGEWRVRSGLSYALFWNDLLPDSFADCDADGVADGWELYVGANPLLASDAATDADSDSLTLLEEYDFGRYPTNPNASDTDGDGVRDDFKANFYLKWTDSVEDFDGDGLSNYSEFLISNIFAFAACDPAEYASDGTVCDYYTKVGDLYLGEIFQDHDQVDDAWEREYATAANMYVHDASRDDDKDGWSNYAEAKANTDPTTGEAITLLTSEGSWSRPEYPIPVIEAKVVYNGKGVLPSNLVFKAWNEADQDSPNPTSYRMTSAPDGTWSFSTAAAGEQSRYLGRMPSVSQQYVLSGGSVAFGTFKLKLLNQNFDRTGYASTNSTNTVSGVARAGDPEDALWYLAARDDGNGTIVTVNGDVEIGTIDYLTGRITIDFGNEVFSGFTYGKISDKKLYSISADGADSCTSFDRFTFAGSHALVEWQAKNPGTSVDGTYYLSDDGCHVREGKNSFICYVADASGAYVPGQPFGVVRGVDVGWQGASFTISLSDTSAITPRVNIWDSTSSDRSVIFSEYTTQTLTDSTATPEELQALSNTVQQASAEANTTKARLRIVRWGVNNMYAYRAGVGFNVSNVIDRTFDANGRSFLCEADFLQDGELDIEWSTLSKQVIDCKGVKMSSGVVTNMAYLAVLEGGSGFESWVRGASDSNTVIRALATTIERRFEYEKHAPVAENVNTITYSARPTFRWSLPNEEMAAKKYGTSYTAFKLKIFAADGTKLYDSGMRRAPAQDADGIFAWTADASAGDLLASGKVFAQTGNYTWQVAMYNAKFKECADERHCPTEEEKWIEDIPSAPASFSVAVNAQQEMNDHQYSSIDVAVKYAGPVTNLSWYTNLAVTNGKVRVQAFATADFAGEPLSETVVTTGVTDLASAVANARLIGLPATGTYYIRAYIDSNGDHQREEWESYGAAKDPVVLTTSLVTAPVVGVYIEDCDVDQDWLPDAWEYASGTTNIQYITSAYVSTVTGRSTGAPGASLTTFMFNCATNVIFGTR